MHSEMSWELDESTGWEHGHHTHRRLVVQPTRADPKEGRAEGWGLLNVSQPSARAWEPK